MNVCDEGCVAGIECANQKHTLVGASADIQCELRAFDAECLADPAIQASATPLLNFDSCLIASHQAPESLRACEKECGIAYTGDVCARFPAPEGG